MTSLLAILSATLFVLQVAGCVLVILRFLRTSGATAEDEHPPLTVLRPVCGADEDLARTLDSTFSAPPAQLDVVFCVASETDPAIPVVREVMARHPDTPARLLIGESRISRNPKLNNLMKGWQAARQPWIAMIDSNVLLPPDYPRQLFGRWDDKTGLVTSPPSGIEPEGLAGTLECAFLNSYQGRWQLAADELGRGFAQGKVLLWHRSLLDSAGGPAALGRNLAEDVAATHAVRAADKHVRVVSRPFAQPIGHRTLREVWDRQVRWARVRREGFPALFTLEPLTGGLVPFLCALALVGLGALSPAGIAAGVLTWYGAEWVTARVAGWPSAPRDVPIWVLRDVAIPFVWCASLASRGFVWRGNDMSPGKLSNGAQKDGEILQ